MGGRALLHRLGAGLRRWPLLAALAGLAAAPAAAAETLTVFAAASLKESLDEAAAAYRQATGMTVRVSYGASSALARQIEQGAPAQVFISADQDWMDHLQRRGRVDAADRRDLLGNRLVLVAPAAAAAAPVALQSGVDLRPLLGAHGRLAMGQPDAVPAGRYARAALQSLGAWPALEARVAGAENVRAALMLVARGEAPLGVVYATDAAVEPRVRVLATFPQASHPAIVYPAARVAASRHPHAPAFLRWLQGPAAHGIFVRHGFLPH